MTTTHRGRGVGQCLLAEAERLTRDKGLKRLAIGVLCGNDGALEAYRRFGFERHATEMLKALD
ncbi:MAG: GNAT family N-acetyltransferase [Hyphomicrobiales bacterium]